MSSLVWTYCAIVMAPKDPKMSKQVGNTRFQQFLKNLEVIKLKSDESRSVVMAWVINCP